MSSNSEFLHFILFIKRSLCFVSTSFLSLTKIFFELILSKTLITVYSPSRSSSEYKLRKFIKNKESYEFTLSQAKLRAAEKLNEKLNSWSSVRSWKNQYKDSKRFEIKEMEDLEPALKKVCKQETKRYVEKLPKYKVIKDLELLEEQARNVLYSGRDIMQVWKHLGMTFKTSGVPVAAPKDFLQLESK